MVKQGLDVLSMYLIIFLPLIALLAMGQLFLFIAYGGVIALGMFFSCLASTIKADMAARGMNRKPKGKRYG